MISCTFPIDSGHLDTCNILVSSLQFLFGLSRIKLPLNFELLIYPILYSHSDSTH